MKASANPSEAAVTYQWYETTGTVNEFSRRPVDGTAIEGETKATLELPDDLSVGEHYYYCVVSAEGLSSKTSYASKVNVLASAAIEYQKQAPATVEVTVGNIDSTLEVDASVTPDAEVTYQWYSSASADGSNGKAIQNETDKTFVVPKNLAVGTYYYYCVASAEGAENLMSRVTAVKVNYDIYKWYDGNNFTDAENKWFTGNGGLSSNQLSVTVNTDPNDGIDGVVDSYANISGTISGNRAAIAKVAAPPQELLDANKEYYIEYDVRFESTSAGYIDVGIWPENANVGSTNAIFRLSMNTGKELYWACDTTRGASATTNGTKISDFSGTLNQWMHVQVNLDYETMMGSIRVTSLEPGNEALEYKAEFALSSEKGGETVTVSDSIRQFGALLQRKSTSNASVSIANAHFFTVDETPQERITAVVNSDNLKHENGVISGNVAVNVKNYENDNLSAAVILAVYDDENKLVYVESKDNVTLEKSENNPINFSEINISDANADSYKYKVFVWENLNSAKPLTVAYGREI